MPAASTLAVDAASVAVIMGSKTELYIHGDASGDTLILSDGVSWTADDVDTGDDFVRYSIGGGKYVQVDENITVTTP